MGKEWGPTVWQEMTASSPNKVFTEVSQRSAKKASREKKRKAIDTVKQQRRLRKYSKCNDSTQARKAYSRHDGGISPDDVHEDISSDHLESLKKGFYETKVVITPDKVTEIEEQTRDQAESQVWLVERRKRLTASVAGGIAKMRRSTKRSKKVESLLYSRFRGNAATRYGTAMEDTARSQYQTYQRQNGHPDLHVEKCGLFVSLDNPWLAATPDGLVSDPSETTQPLGLLEIKNPFTERDQPLIEACKKPSFCLEQKADKFTLKKRHDYYYQIQIQLHCTGRLWCDFVLRTSKNLHVERIFLDEAWKQINLSKLKDFYFSALLPELACPRYHRGGIREPTL